MTQALVAQARALRTALIVELPEGHARTEAERLCNELVATIQLVELEDEKAAADALAKTDVATLPAVERDAWVGVARAKKAGLLAEERAAESARLAEEKAVEDEAAAEERRLAEVARVAAERAELEAAARAKAARDAEETLRTDALRIPEKR